jgi:hypothetical protein
MKNENKNLYIFLRGILNILNFNEVYNQVAFEIIF